MCKAHPEGATIYVWGGRATWIREGEGALKKGRVRQRGDGRIAVFASDTTGGKKMVCAFGSASMTFVASLSQSSYLGGSSIWVCEDRVYVLISLSALVRGMGLTTVRLTVFFDVHGPTPFPFSFHPPSVELPSLSLTHSLTHTPHVPHVVHGVSRRRWTNRKKPSSPPS